MSKKFVRNITDTKIKGSIQEPLYTNKQNDILSDGEDVAIRNKNEYHILTDNVKELIAGNEFIRIERVDKNTLKIYGSDVDLSDYAKKDYVDQKIDEIEIDLSDYVTIENFNLAMNDIWARFENYATVEYVDEQIQNIDIDLTDYATKNYVDGLISDIQNEFEDYYTSEQVDSMIENVENEIPIINAEAPIQIIKEGNNKNIYFISTLQNSNLFYTHTFNENNLSVNFNNIGSTLVSENKEIYIGILNSSGRLKKVICSFNDSSLKTFYYVFEDETEYNLNKNRLYIQYIISDTTKVYQPFIIGISEGVL